MGPANEQPLPFLGRDVEVHKRQKKAGHVKVGITPAKAKKPGDDRATWTPWELVGAQHRTEGHSLAGEVHIA